MSLDLDAMSRTVQTHGPVIRVVVAETRGSVPRGPGTAMLVWADGQTGTIGGGALELAATEAARRQLASGPTAALSKHPLGPTLGQCCGGAVTLVSERWDAAALEPLTGAGWHLRRISGAQPVPFALQAMIRAARNAGTPIRARCSDGWLLEPISRPDREIWIHGAGHVGRALVATLSPLPELSISWVDTGPERFPDSLPAHVRCLPAPDPTRAALLARPHAEHFILTYSHDLDLRLCDTLLRHGFGRCGLIGSATKWARFRSRLAALGHSSDSIARITCPIGDPALGKAPQQIAIGVAQQLLASGAPRQASDTPRQDTA